MKKIQVIILCISCCLFGCKNQSNSGNNSSHASSSDSNREKKGIDTVAYNKIVQQLANSDTTGKWPATAPYPLPGAILPYHRIVAFYGNLYSKRMGILGEIPKDSMFKKLKGEIAKWKAADSSLPVMPALHYIAVTAQGSPGADGKHRMRMPFHQKLMPWFLLTFR